MTTRALQATKNKILKLDWVLIILIITLIAIGLLAINSTVSSLSANYLHKQIIYVGLFFPVMIFIALVDGKIWQKYAYIFYFLGLAMLIATYFFGYKAMGATRWLRLGLFNIQPSEFMKLLIILALAKYFHGLSNNIKFYHIFAAIALIVAPFFLIFKQPDLGTSLIFATNAIIVLFIAGLSVKYFIACGILAIISAPFLWFFVLYEYQKNRIMTFLRPEDDPLGTGYNIIQSKIAIGSGGFSGKGYMKGTQGQLNFLPEKHTDFIFTTISEEFGFIGSVATILIYCLIFHRIITISMINKEPFAKFSCAGIGVMLMAHFVVNVSMVTGMLPVVGSSLPLISYGGTMTASTLMAFGFVLNFDLNRKRF
jgi:rod shape determining protein RodA